MEPIDPKAGTDSHGAEEAGGPEFSPGDPGAWSWAEPYRISLELLVGHPRFWLLVAALAALSSVNPVVALALGPVFFLLVVGGGIDRLRGEGVGVAGTWRRWRGRLWPLIGVSALTTVAIGAWVAGMALLTGSAVAVLGSSPSAARILVLVSGGILGMFGVVLQSYFLAYVHEAVLVEGEGVWSSLARSVRLVQGGGSGYASFYLVFMVAFSALQLSLAVGGGVLGAVAHEAGWLGWAFSKTGLVALTFLGSLAQQVLTVAWTCRFLHDRARA